MDFKDYYAILGVKPDADGKEIKKTYQALAKKYHPDVNPGDKAAEERFKEINEAHHAVADPAKRQKYDDLRQDYELWQKRGGQGSYNFDPWQGGSSDGASARTMTPEEFAEMFGDLGDLFGGGRVNRGPNDYGGFSDFFSQIFGGAGQPSYYDDFSKGVDVEGEAEISLEEAYSGTQRALNLRSRKIEAKIPQGIKDNTKLRLKGQGEAGPNGTKGDLFLKVRVRPHPLFLRDGDDLRLKQPVDFYQAVLGGEITVRTINGSIKLKIPPRTQSGKTFRLKGKGMPCLKKSGEYGDLYVKVKIVLPENMTAKEIDVLQKLYAEKGGKEHGL